MGPRVRRAGLQRWRARTVFRGHDAAVAWLLLLLAATTAYDLDALADCIGVNASTGAICLDGSMGGYHARNGSRLGAAPRAAPILGVR